MSIATRRRNHCRLLHVAKFVEYAPVFTRCRYAARRRGDKSALAQKKEPFSRLLDYLPISPAIAGAMNNLNYPVERAQHLVAVFILRLMKMTAKSLCPLRLD